MAGLDDLYQQVILDHAKQRHGAGLRPVPDGGVAAPDSHQLNPLCGDEVTLRLVVGRDGDAGVVRDVSWDAEGCSISQASTSVMHDLVVGGSVARARTLLDAFRAMIRSRGTLEPDEELLGDAVAFAGVGRHANRVKCAMLGWTALEQALHLVADVDGAAAHPTGPPTDPTTGGQDARPDADQLEDAR